MNMMPSPPPRTPMINAPASIIGLIIAFVLVHLWQEASPENQDSLLLWFSYLTFRADVPATSGLQQAAAYWTPVTYAFLHGDWTHLILNSLWMLAFGTPIARRFGTVRFLIFSALCAIAGALLYGFMHAGERNLLIGASAAVSGQLAGAVRLLYAGGASLGAMGDPRQIRALSLGELLENRQAMIFLAIWAGLNFIFGAGAYSMGASSSNIAWESHFGGFFVGLFLFGLLDRKPRARDYFR